LLPDVEAVAIRYLSAHPDVSAFTPRVYWSFNNTVPHVVVTRTGGVASGQPGSVDHVRLDLDVWAGSKDEARDLAETVRQAMHTAPGQILDGVVICACTEVTGPMYLPDTDTEGTPRYVLTVEWTVH
jgi:hypothetical protein